MDRGTSSNGRGHDEPPSGGWSSVVGIVTALIGNVLISLALNTQRYAHIRMSRDRKDGREKRKQRRKDAIRQRHGQDSYGTLQVDVAEHRARVNTMMAEDEEVGDGVGNGASKGYTLAETPNGDKVDTPLIPRVGLPDDNSMPDEKANEAKKEKSYLKSPIWWVGIALMTVGEAGNFLAYGFAPASIVSPLGVVALVSNCLIAPLLLGERFRMRDGVGVIIAIAGCVTVVISASGGSNPRLTPDAIWDLISRWEFLVYFGVTLSLIALLGLASNKYGDRTILIDLGLVGLLGGYTALSTKGIASLLSNSIWRVVEFPITYLLLAVLISTAVLQIKYVNRALQHFDATMVIPTQFVLFTLSVIIGSAVLYRDFERESAGDAAKFFIGCALTFFGVWCITSGRSDDGDADEEFGEQDDAINLLDEENVQPEIREREYRSGGKRASLLSPSAQVPMIRRRGTAESIPPNVLIMPDSMSPPPRLDVAPSDFLQPANSAAIHSDSAASLPQQSNTPDRRQAPQLHATTSTPSVPTTAKHASEPVSSLPTPRTPLNRYISSSAALQSTERPPHSNPVVNSNQNQSSLEPAPRPSAYRHPSVAGLLPGLLTSPLSSSLSAIVADSFRRGGATDPASPSRLNLRRRSSQGQGAAVGVGGGGGGRRRLFANSLSARRPSGAALQRHSIAYDGTGGEWEGGRGETADGDGEGGGIASPSTTARRPGEASTAPTNRAGRTRSLSAALGDFFTAPSSQQQRKRQRLDREDSLPEADVEAPASERTG